MSRMSGFLVAAVVLSLFSIEPATAQGFKMPKIKNTPFDAGTWNPMKKGGNSGSGFTVMTPARITSDGRVLGPTSRGDHAPAVLGQASLTYQGSEAYWSWNGAHGPMMQRAPNNDRLIVDTSGVIETPQKKPMNNNGFGNNNGFNNNGFNNNGFNNNGFKNNGFKNNGFNNNGFKNNNNGFKNNNGNGQQDPWYEVGRAIGQAIEAEVRKNQGGY